MEETVMEKRGVGERLLHELLKSPRFKAELRMLGGSIDPASAAGLVRVLLWDDVETFMGTTSAAPAMVNYLVRVARELVAQLNTFPPPILVAFLRQLVEGVDFQAMEETIKESRLLIEKLSPVVEGLKEASAGVAAAVEAGGDGKAGAAGAAAKQPAAAKKPAAKKPAGASRAAATKPAAKKAGASGKAGGAGKSGAAGKE